MRYSWAPARPRARSSGFPGARPAPPTSTSASRGWNPWPSATSTRSAGACSSSASATPPWTAAAPACGSVPELEDAEEESVEIVVNHSPKAFVVENGRLTGMTFDVMEYELDAHGAISAERIVGEKFLPADDVILAIGQENAFPWVERDLGIQFDKWDVPVIDKTTFQSTLPQVFFGG